MDVNGTRFHLLLGKQDWGRCKDATQRPLIQSWEGALPDPVADLAWDHERNELTLKPILFQFIAGPKDRPPRIEDRRGAGRDRYGNWYWIDDSGTAIRVKNSGTGVTSHFWQLGDGACETPQRIGDFGARDTPPAPAMLRLCGLAVTENHYLVVGTLQPAGLLVFDLHAGGAPQQILWPEEAPFAPFDMAPMPGGGVWILDRQNQRYWALDRHLDVINQDQLQATLSPGRTDDFQPMDGSFTRESLARMFPAGITLNASSPVAARDPIAIEALPDSTVLILDRVPGDRFSLVYRYRFGQQLGQPVSTDRMLSLVAQDAQADFKLIAHDFAFVPEHTGSEGLVQDRLYIAGADGNQVFAFYLAQENDQLILQPLAEFWPMRLFGGKGLVAASDAAYYDFDDTWVPLTQQRRPRFAYQATLDTPYLDGREPDCVWHRLMLDASIPAEAEVRVWGRAANEETELDSAPWRPEPSLYLRSDGIELPFAPQATGENRGTWELLFQRAEGRFLQIRLELSGNGRVTPRLRALRAYYPRFSYLDHYLPAVYREEPEPASFLDRFFANLEGFYTTIEDKVAAVQTLFDQDSAPSEALEWLALWFGVALDPAWDERRRRLFIRHAMEFFQYRGTMRGLEIALRLALDECADDSLFVETAAYLPRRTQRKCYECPDAPSLADRPSRRIYPGGIRIIEQYRTRQTPAVVLGDATLSGAGEPKQWLPSLGVANLERRFQTALGLAASAPFPILNPGGAQSYAWQQFVRQQLGFIPSALAADQLRWQDFLAHRYLRVSVLNRVYGTTWSSFTDVPLPTRFPTGGAPLQDWLDFQGVVLAMYRTAHRFTVMLPAPKMDNAANDEHRRRQALAQRIVELEKPAHTVFEVKFYWAMFRVGQARLGEDTLIDLGSRAPQWMPPMVLGQGHLAAGYLAPGHPQNVSDRTVLGRDKLET